MKKVVLLTMILVVGLIATVSANVYLGHDAETDSDVYIDEYNIPQYDTYQTQANLHFVKNGEDTYKPVLINWDYSKKSKTHTKLIYRYEKYGNCIDVKKNHWSWAMADFLKDKKKLPTERIFMKYYTGRTHYEALDRIHIDMSRAMEGWVRVTIASFRKSDGELIQRVPIWFTRKNGYYYMKFMRFEHGAAKVEYGSPYMTIASWLNSNGYM